MRKFITSIFDANRLGKSDDDLFEAMGWRTGPQKACPCFEMLWLDQVAADRRGYEARDEYDKAAAK